MLGTVVRKNPIKIYQNVEQNDYPEKNFVKYNGVIPICDEKYMKWNDTFTLLSEMDQSNKDEIDAKILLKYKSVKRDILYEWYNNNLDSGIIVTLDGTPKATGINDTFTLNSSILEQNKLSMRLNLVNEAIDENILTTSSDIIIDDINGDTYTISIEKFKYLMILYGLKVQDMWIDYKIKDNKIKNAVSISVIDTIIDGLL